MTCGSGFTRTAIIGQNFTENIFQELRAPEGVDALATLGELLSEKTRVTLLFASKDSERNNAVVLKEVMEGTKKPPHTTRPASAQLRRSRRGR